MTQSDATNEGREEKQRIEKDAIEYENKNPYDAIHSAYFMGAMIEHNKLRDQLSKEREKNTDNYWRSQFSFLQKDYDEQAKQLEKEREKYALLKQEVAKFIFWHDKFFNDTIVGQPPSLKPLRDMVGNGVVEVQSYEDQFSKEREMRKELENHLSELLSDYENHCVWLDFEKRTEAILKKASELDKNKT